MPVAFVLQADYFIIYSSLQVLGVTGDKQLASTLARVWRKFMEKNQENWEFYWSNCHALATHCHYHWSTHSIITTLFSLLPNSIVQFWMSKLRVHLNQRIALKWLLAMPWPLRSNPQEPKKKSYISLSGINSAATIWTALITTSSYNH